MTPHPDAVAGSETSLAAPARHALNNRWHMALDAVYAGAGFIDGSCEL